MVVELIVIVIVVVVPSSSVGIATDYGMDGGGEIFRTRQDRPWGPSSPFTMDTVSLPGVKRPGRGADNPPPSSAEVENE
jgi:hypothetical protein